MHYFKDNGVHETLDHICDQLGEIDTFSVDSVIIDLIQQAQSMEYHTFGQQYWVSNMTYTKSAK
jgi:hypothetical protein